MINKVKDIYYGDNSLKGYSYVFYLHNLTDNQRHQLATRIIKHEGVYSNKLENNFYSFSRFNNSCRN